MSILDNVFKGIEMNNLYTRTYLLFTQQQNDANWKLNETKSVFKIILAKKWGKNKKVLKKQDVRSYVMHGLVGIEYLVGIKYRLGAHPCSQEL